eukprot:s716_g8.t1
MERCATVGTPRALCRAKIGGGCTTPRDLVWEARAVSRVMGSLPSTTERAGSHPPGSSRRCWCIADPWLPASWEFRGGLPEMSSPHA